MWQADHHPPLSKAELPSFYLKLYYFSLNPPHSLG